MSYILGLLLSFTPNYVHADYGLIATSAAVRTFTPDGCSLFPEGTVKEPSLWAHCCMEHDLFYWAGGVKIQRLHADQNLRQCFRDVGEPILANFVYLAVRTGRFYPFRFRSQQWGNAWSVRRNYRHLNLQDIDQIETELENYDLPTEVKMRLIQSLESQNS